MSEATRKPGLPVRIKMRHDNHFVEELAVRHVDPVGRMEPLSALEPDPEQPRSSMGDLSDLVASIRDKGVLEPILVRPNPQIEEDPTLEAPAFRIISGERRFRAATEAGLYEVPIIEMHVGEDEALEIALIENLQRKDLNPFEESEGYRSLSDLHGYTHEEIAHSVGKSRSAVTETLSLLDMPAQARAAALALDVSSKSLLLQILKATDEPDEMIALIERVAEQGLSRDDLRRERIPKTGGRAGARKKPYVFKFRSPDKTFNLAVTFRRSEVDRGDLIAALEQIVGELRDAENEDD